jgi:hypothetical protein
MRRSPPTLRSLPSLWWRWLAQFYPRKPCRLVDSRSQFWVPDAGCFGLSLRALGLALEAIPGEAPRTSILNA